MVGPQSGANPSGQGYTEEPGVYCGGRGVLRSQGAMAASLQLNFVRGAERGCAGTSPGPVTAARVGRD